jgi:NADH-quinone oxidoreductase subunit L
MPKTFWCMTVATFTIAGFPPLAAFFSKDEILWKTWASGNHVLWLIGVIAAGMTSFYMFRLWFMTFFGEYRGETADDGHHGHDGQDSHGSHHGPHESPMVMIAPLIVLAVLSFVGGWVGVPAALGGSDHFDHFLDPVFVLHSDASPSPTTHLATGEEATAQHDERGTELLLMGISVGAAAIGFLGAWYLYFKRTDLPAKMAAAAGGLYTFVLDKYKVDEFYGAAVIRPIVLVSTNILWKGIDATLIDGAVNESAAGAQDVSDGLRHMQSGNIRSYAGWVAFGGAIVIAFMVWKGVR